MAFPGVDIGFFEEGCDPPLLLTAFPGVLGDARIRYVDVSEASDFQPGHARPADAGSPASDRIMLALSADGLSWTKTGVVAGVYRIYFTLARTDGDRATFSAWTDDLATMAWTADVLPEGANAIYEGQPYDGEDTGVADPAVLWVGDHYELFGGGVSPDGPNHHATSVDGLTFTPVGDGFDHTAWHEVSTMGMPSVAVPMMVANGLRMDGRYRWYGFTGEDPPRIVSMVQGYTGEWQPEAGVRLELDGTTPGESLYVMDSAVARRPGGYRACYVMAYTTYNDRIVGPSWSPWP